MKNENIKNIFYIKVYGTFRVFAFGKEDITPRGRKSCAILALLAMSPHYEHSRSWLQDKLWSDRGNEQGAASLRQCIVELKQAFRSDPDALIIDRTSIQLNREKFKIQELSSIVNEMNSEPTFLEGLDIVDNEFEEWLRDQRERVRDEFLKLTAPAPKNNSVRHLSNSERIAPYTKLVIFNNEKNWSDANQVTATSISDAVGKIVSDAFIADIYQRDPYDSNHIVEEGIEEVFLQTKPTGKNDLFRIALHEAKSQKVLWSDLVPIIKAKSGEGFGSHTLRSINIAADAVMRAIANSDNSDDSAKMNYLKGVKLVQEHTLAAYQEADKCFERANTICANGVFQAWRAYIRSFIVAELYCSSENKLMEEATYFVANAIELAPQNSLVYSLCAHVKSTVFLSFIPAYEMARRSIELNPANAFGWACLGIAECHLGRPKAGMEHCLMARKIAGTSLFRYHIDILSCIVAVMSGDYEQAKHFGESTHDTVPKLAAPLRFLTALYFSEKDEKSAWQMVEKLNSLEPGFSVEHLLDPSYPCESLRKSSLIDSLPSREI